MKANSFICDYYVCFNRKSEFIFMVVQEVKAFSLAKKFLLQKIFPKYPHIAVTIKKGTSDRYKKNVRQRLLKYRVEHVMEINKKSSYKSISIMLKNDLMKLQQAPNGEASYSIPPQISTQQEIKMSKNETDLN